MKTITFELLKEHLKGSKRKKNMTRMPTTLVKRLMNMGRFWIVKYSLI